MTDKLELKSCHEVVYTVDVADVNSIFYCKPTDPDILTVLMKDGKRLYCDEVCPIDSLQEEPVSTKDKLLALSDGRLHLGWIDDAKVVEFEECLMQFHEDMNNIPQGTDSLTRLKDTDGVLHSYSKKLMSIAKEEPVSKDKFTFTSLPRLLNRIKPTDRAKWYSSRLADALEKEGYITDAKIVRESIKLMNGEKVPMATMDEESVSEGIK